MKATVKISDSVLDDEDFPTAEITIANGNVVDMTHLHKFSVAYKLPDMMGWTVKQLQEWSNYDATGYHPETYHDVFVDGERVYNIEDVAAC